jgi:hypothetical protein
MSGTCSQFSSTVAPDRSSLIRPFTSLATRVIALWGTVRLPKGAHMCTASAVAKTRTGMDGLTVSNAPTRNGNLGLGPSLISGERFSKPCFSG